MHRERKVPENRPLELSTRRSRWLGEIAVVVRYHSDPCRYSFYYKTQAGRQAGGLVIITTLPTTTTTRLLSLLLSVKNQGKGKAAAGDDK
jgi:hypothetical protein